MPRSIKAQQIYQRAKRAATVRQSDILLWSLEAELANQNLFDLTEDMSIPEGDEEDEHS